MGSISETQRTIRNQKKYSEQQQAARDAALRIGLAFARESFEASGTQHPGIPLDHALAGGPKLPKEGVCFSAKRARHPKRGWVGPGRHSQVIRARVMSQSTSGRTG